MKKKTLGAIYTTVVLVSYIIFLFLSSVRMYTASANGRISGDYISAQIIINRERMTQLWSIPVFIILLVVGVIIFKVNKEKK